MTENTPDERSTYECDDEPKLTEEEWQAIEVLSRRDDA